MVVVESVITVDAPAEIAWEVVTDLPNYPQWNPYNPLLVSTLEIGAPIEIHFHMKPGRPISIVHEEIVRHEPGREFAFHTLYPRWLMYGVRLHRIEPLSPTQCTYLNNETFTGLALPILVWGFQRDLQAGFDVVAQSLKRRAEALYAERRMMATGNPTEGDSP